MQLERQRNEREDLCVLSLGKKTDARTPVASLLAQQAIEPW